VAHISGARSQLFELIDLYNQGAPIPPVHVADVRKVLSMLRAGHSAFPDLPYGLSVETIEHECGPKTNALAVAIRLVLLNTYCTAELINLRISMRHNSSMLSRP
jgi:hypothetical protein